MRFIPLHVFASNNTPIVISVIRSSPPLFSNVPWMIDEGYRHGSQQT